MFILSSFSFYKLLLQTLILNFIKKFLLICWFLPIVNKLNSQFFICKNFMLLLYDLFILMYWLRIVIWQHFYKILFLLVRLYKLNCDI